MKHKVIKIDRIGGLEKLQEILDNNLNWTFLGCGTMKCADHYESGGRPKILGCGPEYEVNFGVFASENEQDFNL